ncbi:hypothetical protein pdam_00003156 [Pocillopora damicornis]|uniref:Uncharacterized protein n=1 Tax=Pocillopora damicornis TaxID=46731 RepID=A0A3M6UBC5_POCDA|nr:hypothetical protein pdam_00003156 [Pocillopora damicornis]
MEGQGRRLDDVYFGMMANSCGIHVNPSSTVTPCNLDLITSLTKQPPMVTGGIGPTALVLDKSILSLFLGNVASPQLWNDMLLGIRSCDSLDDFKKKTEDLSFYESPFDISALCFKLSLHRSLIVSKDTDSRERQRNTYSSDTALVKNDQFWN